MMRWPGFLQPANGTLYTATIIGLCMHLVYDEYPISHDGVLARHVKHDRRLPATLLLLHLVFERC